MQFVQEDEDYFRLMNEELEKEVGVNVLGEMAKGEKKSDTTRDIKECQANTV